MSTRPKTVKAGPLRYRLAMVLYQAVWSVAMPLVWRYFHRRADRDTAYGEHLDERMGLAAVTPVDVWIHAVSLGEFRSAVPVIERLIAAGRTILITHATPAGRNASTVALAEAIGQGQLTISYAPLDRHGFWMRLFKSARPKIGLVFEMEFWPGMVEAAVHAGVPIWFVNSQIPEKSFPRARFVHRLFGAHPVSRASGVLAKSTRMADRFRALSADPVDVAGETRFDIAPPEYQVGEGNRLAEAVRDRPVYVFASVVEGEETIYLQTCEHLVASFPKPLVLWVPRAPEAFDSTADLLVGAGLNVTRRSEAFDTNLKMVGDLSNTDVLLGDSFGEMFFYLAAGDVVSVGGGFVEKGAHNVIEPLALGKPVIVGPHVWTIEFPGREARDAGVLKVCDDHSQLSEMLAKARGTSANKAEAFHRANLGASERIVSLVDRELEPQE